MHNYDLDPSRALQTKVNGDAVKAKDEDAAAAEKPPPLLETVKCLDAAWRGASADTAAIAGVEVAEALTVPLEPGSYPHSLVTVFVNVAKTDFIEYSACISKKSQSAGWSPCGW